MTRSGRSRPGRSRRSAPTIARRARGARRRRVPWRSGRRRPDDVAERRPAESQRGVRVRDPGRVGVGRPGVAERLARRGGRRSRDRRRGASGASCALDDRSTLVPGAAFTDEAYVIRATCETEPCPEIDGHGHPGRPRPSGHRDDPAARWRWLRVGRVRGRRRALPERVRRPRPGRRHGQLDAAPVADQHAPGRVGGRDRHADRHRSSWPSPRPTSATLGRLHGDRGRLRADRQARRGGRPRWARPPTEIPAGVATAPLPEIDAAIPGATIEYFDVEGTTVDELARASGAARCGRAAASTTSGWTATRRRPPARSPTSPTSSRRSTSGRAGGACTIEADPQGPLHHPPAALVRPGPRAGHPRRLVARDRRVHPRPRSRPRAHQPGAHANGSTTASTAPDARGPTSIVQNWVGRA